MYSRHENYEQKIESSNNFEVNWLSVGYVTEKVCFYGACSDVHYRK